MFEKTSKEGTSKRRKWSSMSNANNDRIHYCIWQCRTVVILRRGKGVVWGKGLTGLGSREDGRKRGRNSKQRWLSSECWKRSRGLRQLLETHVSVREQRVSSLDLRGHILRHTCVMMGIIWCREIKWWYRREVTIARTMPLGRGWNPEPKWKAWL